MIWGSIVFYAFCLVVAAGWLAYEQTRPGPKPRP